MESERDSETNQDSTADSQTTEPADRHAHAEWERDAVLMDTAYAAGVNLGRLYRGGAYDDTAAEVVWSASMIRWANLPAEWEAFVNGYNRGMHD